MTDAKPETASDLVAKLGKKADAECAPCKDGPCAIQPCGYHCKYPYADDSTMWAENCPDCHERQEARKRHTALAEEHFELVLEALEAGKEARLATGRQSTCAQQVHGDSHIQCGRCFICLERKALATVATAAKEAGA